MSRCGRLACATLASSRGAWHPRASRVRGDECRGARPRVVQRPTAGDEPCGGAGAAQDVEAAAATALLHCRGLRLELGDRAARGGGLQRCQRGVRGVDVHGCARRRLRCGGARIRGRSATGLGSTEASAQLERVGDGHGLAAGPTPARPVRRRRGRRRCRHPSTRPRLPRRAQRDRLRTPGRRGGGPGRSRSTTCSGSSFRSRRSCWWWCAPVQPLSISRRRRRGPVVTSMPSSSRARSCSAATSSSRGRRACSPENHPLFVGGTIERVVIDVSGDH